MLAWLGRLTTTSASCWCLAGPTAGPGCTYCQHQPHLSAALIQAAPADVPATIPPTPINLALTDSSRSLPCRPWQGTQARCPAVCQPVISRQPYTRIPKTSSKKGLRQLLRITSYVLLPACITAHMHTCMPGHLAHCTRPWRAAASAARQAVCMLHTSTLARGR